MIFESWKLVKKTQNQKGVYETLDSIGRLFIAENNKFNQLFEVRQRKILQNTNYFYRVVENVIKFNRNFTVKKHILSIKLMTEKTRYFRMH